MLTMYRFGPPGLMRMMKDGWDQDYFRDMPNLI